MTIAGLDVRDLAKEYGTPLFVVDEDERHDAPSRTPREEAVVRRQDEMAGGVRVLLLEGADGREPGDGASRRMDRRRPQRIRDALAERDAAIAAGQPADADLQPIDDAALRAEAAALEG